MELQSAFIVLVDISGYTNFITLHKTALLHAEGLITALMESVIDSSDHPLLLNKLEGDAAMFYTPGQGTEQEAADVLRQIHGFFKAFYARQQLMVAQDICKCEACRQIDFLNLKAVVHFGEMAIKRVKHFEELAGSDVIMAHRLLKNSVTQKQYILMSERFYRLLPPHAVGAVEPRHEDVEGLGRAEVYVHFPDYGAEYMATPVHPTARGKLSQLLRLQWHLALRLLGRPADSYRNFPAALPAP